MALVTKPLDSTTWPDFAQLAEDHHGVWSGCWCLGFHEEGKNGVHSPERRRELKEARVADGRAHAALVYDGPRCVGWCQFGSAGELPRIKFQKAYNAGTSRPPDWRITCFFTGRTHRHAVAVRAARFHPGAPAGPAPLARQPGDRSGAWLTPRSRTWR
jgi:hypothetical protein